MSIGFADARHILSRCGFGGVDLREILRCAGLTREEVVDKLLNATDPHFDDYLLTWQPGKTRSIVELRNLNVAERIEIRNERVMLRQEFIRHWLKNIYTSKHILREKMVLFWHNYILTGINNEPELRSFYELNKLVRQESLGSVEKLVYGLFSNASFLRRFHNTNNIANRLDPRFAEVVLNDIFLGEGFYSSEDAEGITRAMTGAIAHPNTRDYYFDETLHDDSVKRIFGVSERYKPADVPRLLLANTRLSSRIVEHLWLQFISPRPDPEWVDYFAEYYRRSGMNTKSLLREILLSKVFWAEENRGTLVKSPLELIIGTFHFLGYDQIDIKYVLTAAAHMGEELFRPKGSAGWPQTEKWINPESWPARKALTQQMSRGQEVPYSPLPPKKLHLMYLTENGMADEELLNLTLPRDPYEPDIRQYFEDVKRVSAILSSYLYQLK